MGGRPTRFQGEASVTGQQISVLSCGCSKIEQAPFKERRLKRFPGPFFNRPVSPHLIRVGRLTGERGLGARQHAGLLKCHFEYMP
jgi:hypothetical protein